MKIKIVLILSVILLLAGCTVDIMDIKDDPAKFKDQDVTVSAQVNEVSKVGDYTFVKLEAGKNNIVYIGETDTLLVEGKKAKFKGRVKTISIPLFPTKFYIMDSELDDKLSEMSSEAKEALKVLTKELKRLVVEDVAPFVEEKIQDTQE
ncbi:hypothetical protein KAI78_01335 [bacterium]|nr:hypothetical protein [bacterium]